MKTGRLPAVTGENRLLAVTGENRLLAVTLGDPNGVGPEIAAVSIAGLSESERKEIMVIGEEQVLFRYFGKTEGLALVPVTVTGFHPRPGTKDPLAGEAALLCLREAVRLAKDGAIQGIVTAPISKETVVSAGHPEFVDHTTFFGLEFGVSDPAMLFDAPGMRVLLATIHIPLSEVPRAITREGLRRSISLAIDYGRRSLGIQEPKIILCGLNPHAGEGGLLGEEEKTIIIPAVDEFRNAGRLVEGPVPADTLFPQLAAGKWDIAIAMYHDQGLAPFKLLHFHDGVNVTLGLPVVRTSPDHGTAWDHAGKGTADPGSMQSALTLAFRLIRGSKSS